MGTKYEISKTSDEPPTFSIRICGTSTVFGSFLSLEAANGKIDGLMQTANQAGEAASWDSLTALERAIQTKARIELDNTPSDDASMQ